MATITATFFGTDKPTLVLASRWFSTPGFIAQYVLYILGDSVSSPRYFGLQVGYKSLGIVLLALASWRAQHTSGLSLEKELDKQPEGPV